MSAAPVISPGLKFKLKVVAGPHLNEIYSLDQAITKIGRGEDNDIKLVNDARISRNHIEIFKNPDHYKFKNISLKNFVTLDGKVMEEGFLAAGAQLQVGETIFEVFNEGPTLVAEGQKLPAAVDASALTVRVALQPPAPSSAKKLTPLNKLNSNVMAQPKPIAPQNQYSIPKMGTAPQPQASRNSAMKPSVQGGKRQFYVIVIAVLGFFGWLLMKDSKPKEIKSFRTSQQVEYDILQSTDERKRLQERLDSLQTTSAQRSQENLIKGFRDFQQGNYARARDNFQVVLNLDPDNAIAKRYYHLSRIKFDELLQFHMLQGLRYRDKKNYRLCRSSFQSALVMIQNSQQHPKYREIKNFFDECNLASEGRY